MTRMPREPEAFGEQVARILLRHFPDREVELAGPMDVILNGKHLGLDNLYRMVQYEPARGLEIVENYLERLVEGDSVSSTPLPRFRTICFPPAGPEPCRSARRLHPPRRR